MSIETMERRVFPCKDATDEEISRAIFFTSRGSGDNAKKLQKMTCRVSGAEIPWDTAEHLGILGSGFSSFGTLECAGFGPGVYTSYKGTWLLLIPLEMSKIQTAVFRCGGRLKSLEVYHLRTPVLDVSSCPLLEELRIRDASWLLRLTGLEELQQLTKLDLSGCRNLSKLPGLEQLQQLTTLDLSGCSCLTELHGLERLQQLTELNLSGCSSLMELHGLEELQHLTTLNLSGCSSLWKLHGLERLQQLTELYLSGCSSLRKLHGLEGLQHLPTLNLSGCSRLTELHGLEGLQHLTELDLSRCSRLTELHGLEGLQHLTELDLSRCSGLKVLPEGIRELKSLRVLNLSNMELKTLPDWLPEIVEGFLIRDLFVFRGTHKANVFLYGTTVEDMEDLSIFEQPYEVIAEWFKNRSQGSTRTLNEIKVVFLGDGEAGKSHTIARLMNDGGEPKGYTDQSTPGIVIKHKPYTYDGRDFRVHYWDFGGQEIMHSMHRIFLTSRTMYVVLLNARDDTQGDRAQYWLHNVQSFAPGAPVVLVLNKIDQNPKASVDERTLRSKYPGLTQIVRLSALKDSKDQFNEKFKEVLLQEIVKTRYLDSQWPHSWIRVKERLEKMESHFILGDEYRRICRECQLDNVELSMLRYFNDLGVSFCFCGEEDYELEDHVILRPDWITNGLYIILFNRLEHARNGLIPHKSIYRLLKSAHGNPEIRCTLPNASYNNSDIQYVLGVMRKFALSFTDGKNNEFIPMLCQQESTVDIADFEKDTETLEFRMEFEYLPDNLLHRLMVERHAELDMDKVWRKGAKFHLSELGLTAVVVIDGGVLRFFIQHTDPLHRPNTYLAMLKANVDRIVEKMGIKAPECKLVYKVHGNRAVFGYDRLLKLHARGRKEEYCEALDEDFLIDDILNQSAPAASEDLNTLLESMISACLHLQGNPNYRRWNENGRNCVVRDSLGDKGYIVLDQTLRGTSASGKSYGELDLLIQRVANRPWVLCEALIAEGYTQKWNEHLDKLLKEYNPHGLSTLFLLTYVDCKKTKFDDIWQKYHQHILTDAPKGFILKPDSVSLDLNNSYEHIKIARCNYLRGSYAPLVYHIFLQMDPK